MVPLNLPIYACKTKQVEGKPYIFDLLRRKYVRLSPEEWVRQHVVHYLINHLGYPRGLLALERGLRYNQRRKRTDLLALNPEGQPLLLVECKAPSVAIDAAVARQATTYNQTIGAPFLLLTNGLVHYCCGINHETAEVRFLDDFPAFV